MIFRYRMHAPQLHIEGRGRPEAVVIHTSPRSRLHNHINKYVREQADPEPDPQSATAPTAARCHLPACLLGGQIQSSPRAQTRGHSSNDLRNPSAAVKLLIDMNPPSDVSVAGTSQPSTYSKIPVYYNYCVRLQCRHFVIAVLLPIRCF